MAAENRAQLMAYSAAATAAALSVTALALTYSTFKGSTEGKSRTEGLTINNYGGQGSSSESYGSGTPTSNAPAASSPPSKLDSADGDTKDKPTDRYKRIIQFYNEREYQWEDREEKKLTPEEEEEAKKLFFTARVREAKENPEETLILVKLSNEHLRKSLQDLLAKAVPEIYEETPEFESSVLFHKWDEIKQLLEEKKQAVEAKAKQSGKVTVSIATQTGEDSASPVKADKDGEKDQSEPSKSTVELIDHPKQQAKNPQVEIVTGQSQSQESSKTAALTTKRNKKLSLEDLKAQVETLEELLKFLEKEYGKLRAKVIRFKSRGVIDYKTMWAIFPPGSRVVIEDEDSGEPTAIEVTETEYLNSHMRGKRFSISGTQIQWQGSKFVKTTESAEIKSFRGQRTLSSLKVEPLSDAKKAELTARGRKYVTYAGSYYMQYEGDLIMVHFSEFTGKKSIVRESARGRVMVDRESYKILNPSGYGVRSEDSGMECDCASCIANTEFDLEADRYASGEDTSEDEDEEDQGIPIVAPSAPKPTRTIEKDGVEVVRLHEDELCLLPPCHFGFSFALRAWGQMLVTYEPIKFDDEAFDHLVMDEVPKTAIKSLVDSTRKENYASDKLVKDFISGKGGGLIVVLYGTPGTGKTLTAEAVAERLQRPLYIVSSGQLGIEADKLEMALQKTLELSERWNCVTLIDEADVFLEARSMHEMTRNALVAVFLKALERFHSTLFLTTNRVETFDHALVSRCSIAIKYSELDTPARRAIWKRFLTMAGVTIVASKKKKQGELTNGEIINGEGTSTPHGEENGDAEPKPTMTEKQLDTLAADEINGRQVKQIVRSAQALALAAKEPLGLSHCKTMLDFTKKFAAEFQHPGEIDYTAKDSQNHSRSHLYR